MRAIVTPTRKPMQTKFSYNTHSFHYVTGIELNDPYQLSTESWVRDIVIRTPTGSVHIALHADEFGQLLVTVPQNKEAAPC